MEFRCPTYGAGAERDLCGGAAAEGLGSGFRVCAATAARGYVLGVRFVALLFGLDELVQLCALVGREFDVRPKLGIVDLPHAGVALKVDGVHAAEVG